MSSTMLTTVQEWQDEFFDLFDRVDEPVVKVTGDVAETVSEYVPQLPAWPFLAQTAVGERDRREPDRLRHPVPRGAR